MEVLYDGYFEDHFIEEERSSDEGKINVRIGPGYLCRENSSNEELGELLKRDLEILEGGEIAIHARGIYHAKQTGPNEDKRDISYELDFKKIYENPLSYCERDVSSYFFNHGAGVQVLELRVTGDDQVDVYEIAMAIVEGSDPDFIEEFNLTRNEAIQKTLDDAVFFGKVGDYNPNYLGLENFPPSLAQELQERFGGQKRE